MIHRWFNNSCRFNSRISTKGMPKVAPIISKVSIWRELEGAAPFIWHKPKLNMTPKFAFWFAIKL
jgi:hypothetical protein